MMLKTSKPNGQFWKTIFGNFSKPTRSAMQVFFFVIPTINVSEKANLDKNTTYELIRGHGRTDMYLFFATVIGDFERVVEHWILEEEWVKAIDVISGQVCWIFHSFI
jgi:hypothetical protein